MNVSVPRLNPSRVAVAVLTVAALLLVPRLVGVWSVKDPPPVLNVRARADPNSRSNDTDSAIAGLQQRLRTHPREATSYIGLAQAYLQKVRESGDPALYTKTDALLHQAETLEPNQADLFATQGTLALARHDFATALKLGQHAVQMNPQAARYYGVVVDAQTELGMYDAARDSLQAMVDHRPDFNSFSRIAYARELRGDTEGAIAAMQRTIAAGGAVPENAAWAYVQLGNLYFGRGNLTAAQHNYDSALLTLANYPAALAGQGRVATANGQLQQATVLFQSALDRMPLPEYAIALGDIYAQLGHQAQAQRQYGLVQAMDQLLSANGVNTDLETALFFADHNLEIATALKRAQAAHAARHSINAADSLAWTLYKSGDPQAAEPYAAEALKLGTQDALKLFHAGMIAHALGKPDQARGYLHQALDLNPHFSLLYSDLAVKTLSELQTVPHAEGTK